MSVTKSEVEIVKYLGARATVNSGTLAGCKSDFILDIGDEAFRGECKSTEARSIRIDKNWLCKIAGEALETNRYPVLVASFVTTGGERTKDGDWALVPLRKFREMLFALDGLREELESLRRQR
jgi:hypothetical protein